MNGIGIGLTVGLGTTIGLALVSPGAATIEYIASFAFYGGVSGLTFHIWKLALRGWKPPFIRRR